MKRLALRLSIGAAALLLAFVVAWGVAYPGDGDPKNLHYLLWKAGICPMNLDRAAWTMIGDANRREIVIGKTSAQLKDRFGILKEPKDASHYLQSWYFAEFRRSALGEKQALFIRDSPWMIVLDGGVAIDLILVKGW